ncbi:actin-related protein 7 [Cinnamomum micranthum f. kanehirae]|uniref:Actin-related protein 7 n=1 Tax=Cinnamomum micranthum f. kanehirae TaxID=337451 RepID=A0A3S3NJB3_9MAGN|nr:actin-related protein 7 [Cinnamomum micranthum f. kanehirae]
MEAVVVDAGSKLLKAGFAAPDQDPALIIPTKMKRMLEDGDLTDSSMFEDVSVDPVMRGFIKDWDAMEDLLHYVLYTGLGWEIGNEGQILFTDPLSTPKAVRERLVQLMFETFNISGFYASEQAVLSLYAVGRISGCTVDIGHGKIGTFASPNPLVRIDISEVEKIERAICVLCGDQFAYEGIQRSCPAEKHIFQIGPDIAPVCEGAVQHIASKRFEIGGIDLTKLLAQELRKSNPLVSIDISEVEKLKEQYASCADDQFAYEGIQRSCPAEKHTLPDGQVITIGKEKYLVGEALFQPSILGLEEHGIVEQLVRSISSVSSENQRQLLENTVLCGGTSSMLGFEDRFQKEANLCSSSIRPSLVKPPEYMPENLPKNSAWMGGAILAKVVFPQNQHVTKADYDETGPVIVHKKCF